MKKYVLSFVVLALGGGGTAPSLAQVVSQQPIHVEVNVVRKLIQVSVTDRKGNPVMDLTPADFEVRDDGEVIPIDFLEKHVYGRPAEAPAVTAVSPQLSRKFFFIFDFAFMDVIGLPKAKQAACDFIDNALQPGDEIALVSYSSNKNLTVHEYLTTDHRRVREFIENFGQGNNVGRTENLMDYLLIQKRLQSDAAYSAEKGGTAPDAEAWFSRLVKSRNPHLVLGQERGYVGQIIQFSESLSNLARTLRQVPGNKNMLFFSNGIMRQALYGRQAKNIAVQDEWGDAESLGTYLNQNSLNLPGSAARDAYTEMLDEFKAANCPVYSFNVAAETMLRYQDELLGDDALRQFSSNTGGKYYSNLMNSADAVADLKSITGAYYVLGFDINDTPDGDYHKIQVKVARKGMRVRSQAGYFNPRPFKALSEFEKILHLTEVALADTPKSGLLVPVDLFPVPIRTEGVGLVSVYARLSAESMGDLLGKKTEALFFVSDTRGDNPTIKRFFLDDLPAGREGFFLNLTLPLKPGAYEARLILRDLDTGRTARGVAAFQLWDLTPAAFWMDPLLLLEEGGSLSCLSPTPELTLNAFYGYDPDKYFPRAGEVSLGTEKIQGALRCGNMGDRADVKFTGWIQNTGNNARMDVPVVILDQGRLGTVRVARLEISLGDLPAGNYSVNVNAEAPGASVSPLASASFTIK